jgi:hypothetical protein
MIDRVTQHRPRLYGKVSMTSGFFQTAIDERSRPFTAFITSTGLFQWCRLPMGLKGVASYFQRMMASKVLAGLLYIFVELYLDDVLVYATNDDEFFERLRIIALERFRQFNIALNPKNCYFGLTEVEFVGHVLKSDGVCFFTEKRTKVLDFPLRVKQKQLKSFLGLVNYFRDHVKGLSHKAKPLNDIMIPYEKGTSIDWTPRLKQCFRDVQESVGKCPKLFYVDMSLPIHVRTDAPDYGIAGYIFQLDQQKELPIRFISKALPKAQVNWSTFEKEAIAIFYTITKFDVLLRDIRFLVETDYKNLTFLKTAQSVKVRRWQLALQEFDIRYIHIKGKDNVVADALSRLCDQHLMNEVAKAEMLTAFLISGDSSGIKEPTIEPRPSGNSGKPVTTEPAIDPNLRAKIEAVCSQGYTTSS